MQRAGRGLMKKRRIGGWQFCRLVRSFGEEICVMREVLKERGTGKGKMKEKEWSDKRDMTDRQ